MSISWWFLLLQALMELLVSLCCSSWVIFAVLKCLCSTEGKQGFVHTLSRRAPILCIFNAVWCGSLFENYVALHFTHSGYSIWILVSPFWLLLQVLVLQQTPLAPSSTSRIKTSSQSGTCFALFVSLIAIHDDLCWENIMLSWNISDFEVTFC